MVVSLKCFDPPGVVVRVGNHKNFQFLLCTPLTFLIGNIPALFPDAPIRVVESHCIVHLCHVNISRVWSAVCEDCVRFVNRCHCLVHRALVFPVILNISSLVFFLGFENILHGPFDVLYDVLVQRQV